MKRAKDLFDKIVDMDNLRMALRLASRGKKRRKSVTRTLNNAEEKLELLHNLLITGQYHPMPYSKKTITDRCTCKIREIYVPKFFPDQIVQWAIMIVLKPIMLKGMYDYSCASVDNRGGTYGINTVKKWITKDEKNTKYCLVMDIKKFYPNIDQNLLMDKFRRKIKDEKTLELIQKIVCSIPSGLPIGNFTSQWFANFFLQDFDHFVKEKLKIKHYIRYMDDMVFFSANKRFLRLRVPILKKYLDGQRLSIKSNWQIFKLAINKKIGRPLDFLGYKFYRNFFTMRSRTFLRAVRRIKKIGKKPILTAKDSCAVLSYVARINMTSGTAFYDKYVKPFVNLRACKVAISLRDKKIFECNKLLA